MVANQSHTVVPIPAFDIHDNLISPALYEKTLKGAIVRVTATIMHQFMPSTRSDNFYADLLELTVIRVPMSGEVLSPSKRKLEAAMDRARQLAQEKAQSKASGSGAKRQRRG